MAGRRIHNQEVKMAWRLSAHGPPRHAVPSCGRAAPGELVAREIAVFITGRALTTVGKGCRAQVIPTGGPGLRWR